MTNVSEIVTTVEFASRLGISADALRKRLYREKGYLPEPIKLGRQVVWPRNVVEKFFFDLGASKNEL